MKTNINTDARNVKGKPAAKSAANDNKPRDKLIYTSAEFMSDIELPDFTIEGMLQRSAFYVLTGKMSTGKTAIALTVAAHVALGRPLAGRAVEKGRVLYLAGENYRDVQWRWKVMAELMDFDVNNIDVEFIKSAFELKKRLKQIQDEAKGLTFVVVIVDTAQAYFSGEERNSNDDQLKYAYTLRKLSMLPGDPMMIVLAHPNKGGDQTVPYGGGSFLNEADGNMYLTKEDETRRVTLHRHDKFRGPRFKPLVFELVDVTLREFKDKQGNDIILPVAVPMELAEAGLPDEPKRDLVAEIIGALSGGVVMSAGELAKAIGFGGMIGSAGRSKVYRELQKLKEAGDADQDTHGHWRLTDQGELFANSAEQGVL